MASSVESGTYGAINTTYTSTNGFNVIMFTSGTYKLQKNTTIDGQIITSGELFVRLQHICSLQIDNNWYWNQKPKHHGIKLLTGTIIHPQHEVNAVTDFHAIPTSICTRTQAKKSISR